MLLINSSKDNVSYEYEVTEHSNLMTETEAAIFGYMSSMYEANKNLSETADAAFRVFINATREFTENNDEDFFLFMLKYANSLQNMSQDHLLSLFINKSKGE